MNLTSLGRDKQQESDAFLSLEQTWLPSSKILLVLDFSGFSPWLACSKAIAPRQKWHSIRRRQRKAAQHRAARKQREKRGGEEYIFLGCTLVIHLLQMGPTSNNTFCYEHINGWIHWWVYNVPMSQSSESPTSERMRHLGNFFRSTNYRKLIIRTNIRREE